MEIVKSSTPIINVRGTKVALGPFMPEHDEFYQKCKQDPEISIFGSGTFDVDAPIVNPENYSLPDRNAKRITFTIFELENLTMIGESVLRFIDYRHGSATFGITIGRKEYWGKGYGTEATKLILDYGFRFLNLYNIDLTTASFNERAMKAYLKAGFKEYGRRHGVLLLNGQRYDDILMECIATDFESPSPGWFSI